MTTPQKPSKQEPHIQQPPSKEELEQVSREQGMISDEWAPNPAQPPDKKP